MESTNHKAIVYTVDDIMDILNVKRKTVHDWIKQGKIKAVKNR